MRRLLTAAVAIPLLLLVILSGPPWLFLAVTIAFAWIGFWELSSLTSRLGSPLLTVGYLGTALLVASFYSSRLSFLHASLLALLLAASSAIMGRSPGRNDLVATMSTVFATFYIGALFGCLVGLHRVEPDPDGRRWIVFLMTVVFIGDAGAYYVGKSLGKRRLAPQLSPKKTLAGLAGDVVFAVAAATALEALWFPTLPWITVVGLGVVLSLVGVLGDLFVSFLKRSADVKDTSSLFPGHGGVLDRVDSILFAAPVLLLCVAHLR